MNKESQRVATPALLRKGLLAFREAQGSETKYKIRDNWKGLTYEFEPWQFFVLEVLPLCDDFTKLASIFNDRFGRSITSEDVEGLFSSVADMKLFGLSADSNPMLAAFFKKRGIRLEAEPQGASTRKEEPGSNYKAAEALEQEGSNAGDVSSHEESLSTSKDASEAIDFDDTADDKGWTLFNPTAVIKMIYPFVLPFKYTIYLLPLLIITAFFIIFHNSALLAEDMNLSRIGVKFSHITYATHTLIGLFTDNLFVTLVSAFVAFSYRATVNSFYIEFHMGFFPRFHVRVGNTKQLSRRERIWLHAAPLMGRFGTISVCTLLWFGTRSANGPIASLAMIIGVITTASLFLAANPLVKSSGYRLLSAVLNEPALRAKAYMAVVNKFRGNVYQKVDSNILAAYALASALFMAATFTVFILIFGSFLKFHLGGAGVILIAIIILLLILRLSQNIKRIGETYERTVQFDRWRKIALPKAEGDIAKIDNKSPALTYLNVFIVSLILVGLLVPYDYEPGGNFVVLPNQKAELTSDIAGIIKEVHFDGGEVINKNAVIARLDQSDYLSQMEACLAKVKEQQAVVDDLKARPKPEEVVLAQRSLEVEITRSMFSEEKLKRFEKLYEEKTISYEEMDDQRRQHQVDLYQAEERRANLELVKTGATPEQIAAAEAKLQSYREECNYYQQKVEQSIIYMPFDGKLEGINLKHKVGHYLNKGEVFATVENTQQVFAQIEVPEPDIEYVNEKAETRVRPYSKYADEDFTGIVTLIDSEVTEKSSGKVVYVLTLLENRDGSLKSGMTGYAKISSKKMPAWEVLSLAIVRFIKVEVWSWIP